MKKKMIIILIFLAAGLSLLGIMLMSMSTNDQIETFDQCVAKGYEVSGNPPSCKTPDGKTFNAPLNSAEGAPTGSIHNLPVPAAVSKVKAEVAKIESVDENQVVIMLVEEKNWTNSCLELSSKDSMCAQVITPGFRIVADASGKEYVFRTNEDGSIIKREN